MNILCRAQPLHKILKLGMHFEMFIPRCFVSTSSKLKDVTAFWKSKLDEINVPEIDESLRLISSHVLNVQDCDVEKCYDHELNVQQIEEFNRCCECRSARIPIQYILKEWQFRDLTLKMTPPVFIPRPETEMLIDIVEENVHNPMKALEIGCGSGAISVSLLKKFPELRMKAIDRSKIACILSSVNAKEYVDNRLQIINTRIQNDGTIENFEEEEWDFIVSNPPYVLSSEMNQLEPEVKLYEDHRALNGGVDGLDIIKAIIRYSSRKLLCSKSCFLEIHHEHVLHIKKWLEENADLNIILQQSYKDFLGYDRFVHLVKKN